MPPISETQVVVIALFMALGGAVIGCILGSLWMEQRMQRHSKRLRPPDAQASAQLPYVSGPEEPAPASKESTQKIRHSA
jgi:hypothetical protein